MVGALVLTFLSASVVIKSVSTISTHPIVVILAFDGFRPEYLERGLNPVLQDFMQKGSTTVRMINQFPTTTFPNFYSIATGMNLETHGVLGKRVFNKSGHCIPYGPALYSYNKDITPIWTLNELSGEGRHSGVVMWSAGEFRHHNILPTYLRKRNKTMPWTKRMDEVISWLTDAEKPANFIAMYFEEPDLHGHMVGPHSKLMLTQLRRVDETVAYYRQQLKRHNISDSVNTIILSDHGMAAVPPQAALINLTNELSGVNAEEYSRCGGNPVHHVRPKAGFEKKILEQFKQIAEVNKTFDVVEIDSMPSHWHLNNRERSGAFLLVAKKPFFFDDSKNSSGTHGYDIDDKDMYPIFIAHGPAFKRNFIAQPFENIDIYPLVSQILNLSPPQVPVNGTIVNIGHILSQDLNLVKPR